MRSPKISLTALIVLTSFVSPLIVSSFAPFSLPSAIAQSPENLRNTAGELLKRGIEQIQTGQVDTAITTWQKALAIYRQIKNTKREGYALENLAKAYVIVKNYSQAIESYQARLDIAKRLQDRDAEKDTLGELGRAFQLAKQYPQAVEYYQQYLVLARSLTDRQAETIALGSLGQTYEDLENYHQAIDSYEQALKIARESQNSQLEEIALGSIGDAYLKLENYGKAIETLEQTLTVARKNNSRNVESKALNLLGNAYYYIGEYNHAIDYQQQSLAIARAIKDVEGQDDAIRSIGNSYYFLDKYEQAISYYEQNLAIARSTQDRRGEGLALGNLALVYTSQGNYAKAIEYYQQDLAIAREFKDRSIEQQALGNLGNAYLKQKEYNKAIENYEQSLAIARELKYRRGEGIVLTNLGVALYQANQLPKAESTLIDGLKVLESLREGLSDAEKVSIFEQQSRAYGALQGVLVAQNKPNNALEIAERGRARAFVDLLSRRLSSSPTAAPTSVKSPTIGQIQQIAKTENATIVEYSLIAEGSKLLIWVVKPTGEIAFRSTQVNTSLQDLIANSRQAIPTRSRASLKQLHQLLIEPIANLLPSDANARTIFVPQQILFQVPFPALLDASNKYLIEKHTILTAPSIQVLDLTHQRQAQVRKAGLKQALVLGNPIMPSVSPAPGKPPQQLDPLPSAEQEAKAIAPILKTKAIIGSQATKAAVLQALPKTRIIHLATHGLPDDNRGLGSWVALTPSGKDNGLLTAEEILNLNLNAELVVLSACATGRGRITGDGIIGLSRAWLSAGASSAIVSLWFVPDAPTATLMTEFYQRFQQNPDKAQALRNAMLVTMKQHPNPRDWAAFTLIGEAN